MSTTKRIAILGTGMVGKALSQGLTKHGFEIVMGTRNPNKAELLEWKQENLPSLEIQTFEEAAASADLIMLAINWSGVDDVTQSISAVTTNKTVVDMTNPLDFASGAPQLAIGFNDSAGETVQRKLSNANVVKALNTVTATSMVDPNCEEGTPDMVIAGNNENAKKQVTELLENIGWRVIDAGDIAKSRYIEPLAMLWIDYAIKTGKSRHMFSLLRK